VPGAVVVGVVSVVLGVVGGAADVVSVVVVVVEAGVELEEPAAAWPGP